MHRSLIIVALFALVAGVALISVSALAAPNEPRDGKSRASSDEDPNSQTGRTSASGHLMCAVRRGLHASSRFGQLRPLWWWRRHGRRRGALNGLSFLLG